MLSKPNDFNNPIILIIILIIFTLTDILWRHYCLWCQIEFKRF